MSDKPVIFISHSATHDAYFARLIQEQIGNVLGLERSRIFLSSDPDAIPAGSNWFDDIVNSLNRADALVVLVTSAALQSIWVGYEIGYFWHIKGGQSIYPAIAPNIQLRGPLEILQGKVLESREYITAFFRSLSEVSIVSDIGRLDVDAIVEAVKFLDSGNSIIDWKPTYLANVYSDEMAKEILREFIEEQYRKYHDTIRRILSNSSISKQIDIEKTIFDGKLLEAV